MSDPSNPPPAEPTAALPSLRSLGPEYDETLHGRHAEVLLTVLSDRSSSAPKNIALAGHYGSGKSSVILGVQEGLDEKGIEWVNLSLSSLGIDDTKRARVQDDGTLPPLTNLIQKEIVKQLLYRKAPKDMPGSRYFRIDSFRTDRAVQWALATALGVFAIAVLAGLVDRVEKVAPATFVSDHGWVPWLAVGLLGAFMGLVCFMALRGLQNPVKVDSFSAGGAAVSLSAKENSYFDEYLDEIVYFFQQTKTKVAIFEDLDRFKDPHIFETLRELNTVLNNSEQVKDRPVKFIYAVRDSIFEQLHTVAEPDKGHAGAASGAPRAAALESTPSANRTKFFDLVVPMVPFLTHRSARDLLAAAFETSPQKPSVELINLVGTDAALTDMRLILNIRNEFEIYRASVLGDDGLQGLTADRLFAMMAYKNTHLEDFEAIRHGTSQIDAAHRAFRTMVEHQVSRQAARSRVALAQAQRSTSWDRRAKVVGERLQQVLPILHQANRRGGGDPFVITSSGKHPMTELTSGKLWTELFESRSPIELGHPGYYTLTVPFDELLLLAGDAGTDMEDKVQADVAELRRRSAAALEVKEFVTKATMAELMARTDLTMPVGEDEDEDERNLNQIVSGMVTPLARDLLAKGFIDENYTLYCSDYHGVAISVSAMNFILHCVQADQALPLFRFDNPSSIDAVETEMGDRFLHGEAVFNVEVFEHFLAGDTGKLDDALDRLAVRAAAGDTKFVDLFLEDDQVTTKDRLVSELTPRWTGMFVHLAEGTAIEHARAFVDAALRSASWGTDYETSEAVTQLIEENYLRMSAFTEPMENAAATGLVELLRGLDVYVAVLADVGQAQRRAVIAGGLYPVTRPNLISALAETEGAEDGEVASLALDVVKDRDRVVYDHVVANLPGYLDALKKGEVTVRDPGEFVRVLGDIVGAPEQMVRSVAQRASESCEVSDLAELDSTIWPAVVAVGRVPTSVSNVSLFVREHGFTTEMAGRLVERDLVDAASLDEEATVVLAYALVEATSLSGADRVRLVGQLELSDHLDPSQFGADGLSIVPQLLAAGEVADDPETYAFVADRPYPFRETYFASSTGVAAYVTELPLSSDDLVEVMKSQHVPHAVKRAIVNDADFVAERISRRGAIAVCEWATKGNDVSTDVLLLLSKAGAPAEYILGLLEPHLGDIKLSALDDILLALGDDYQPLTCTGRHRPRLKKRAGTEPLLDELKRRGRVSSYSEPKFGGGIKVNMRHE